ncbi:MAG: AsmA family protein [Oligoflexia bacterium]|nr:AsmA family protein [Oligoflexia bacterium]
MLKKLLIAFGVLFALLVVVIMAVPLFFDANSLKPQIEKVVKENLEADFTIGDLKLSLWGGINFQISKMVLSEKGSTKPIFAMKDAKLALPYASILGGKPDITLIVDNPEIAVVSDKDGKLNVLKITKPSAAASQAAPSSGDKSIGAAAGLAFDLGFKISNGRLSYIDLKKNSKTELTGLNLDIKKFGLNQPFEINFKSDFNSKEMKDLVLKGPLMLNGTAAIYINSQGLERIDINAEQDLTGLIVKYADLFNKKENVPLKAAVKASASDKNLKMTEIKFTVNDATVTVKGVVENFDNPNMNVEISSTKFVFDNWQQILKPLQEFDLKGAANLGLKVSGTTERLSYNGKAQLSGASLKAPGIVPRVTDVKATLDFNNDTVTLSNSGMKMGESDLGFSGTVKNFKNPVVIFNLTSQNFNVDKLLPQKTPEQIKAEEKAEANNKPMSDAQIEAAVAGPIILMKKNPAMRGLDFTARANMKKITVRKADITNLNTEVNFKNLVMNLKKATAQTFGGSVSFTSMIDFKNTEPAYQVNADVGGIDINAALTNQMPMAKDTLFGKTFGKINLLGAGVTKTRVKQTLKGTINAEIKNGSWSSLTAMKQISEKLASLPGDLKNKVGGINVTDKFRQLKANINVANGRFNITNLVADMETNNTTITGQGWVDFDMNNEISGYIIAPGGSGLPAKYKNSDGRMKIPFDIGCKITMPCLKLERFIKDVATEAVKQEGAKEIKKAIEKIENPQVKELLKKLPF